MMELTAKSIVAHYGHVRDLKVKFLSLAILYCAGVLHVYNAVVTRAYPSRVRILRNGKYHSYES